MNQRIRSRVASWIGSSAVEGVGMGRGSSEAVLPMVELAGGSPGLSVISRPLCPLSLPAPPAPLAPRPAARRPQLRQTYHNSSAPGLASIASVLSRPEAA
jgi:hypothetical protein